MPLLLYIYRKINRDLHTVKNIIWSFSRQEYVKYAFLKPIVVAEIPLPKWLPSLSQTKSIHGHKGLRLSRVFNAKNFGIYFHEKKTASIIY